MSHSIKQLYGHKLGALDGAIGQLVIRTGHRLSGKEVQIPATKIERISYEDSTVWVNLTSEAVEQSPAHYAAAMAEVV